MYNKIRSQITLFIALCMIIIGILLLFIGLFSSQNINTDISEQIEVLEEVDENVSSDVLSAGTATEVYVTKVIDGDTIQVQVTDQVLTIRYIGIDTPETVDPRRPVQCFGHQASAENKRLVDGKSILLEKDISETDKYNRILRYIYVKDDSGNTIFVNEYLVRFGFAKASTYPPDVKYDDLFKEAQQEARENNRGLWSKC